MKKALALILAASLVMAGCGSTGTASSEQSQPAVETQAAEQSAAAEQSGTEQEIAAAETGQDQTDTGTVTIEDGKTALAAYLPLTGNSMQFGISIQRGMELAVKHWNEDNGGINGQDVTIDFYDDKGDTTESVNVANLIVADKDKYIAALGSFSSSCAMAAAPIFEENKLLMFSPTGSHPDFGKLGDYIFAIAMTGKYEHMLYAKIATEELGGKNVGFIGAQSDTTELGINMLKAKCEETGANLYTELFVSGTTKDFTPVISSLFNQGDIDVVLISGDYSTVASIVLQMDSLGLKDEDVKILGTGQCAMEEFLDIVGDTGENIYVVTSAPVYFPSIIESMDVTPTLERFINDYTADYQEMADAFAGQAYDAVMAVLNCVKEYQTTDSEVLKDHVGELSGLDEPCSGDSLEYDMELRQMVKPMAMYQIEDGEFVIFKSGSCSLTDEERKTATEIAGY